MIISRTPFRVSLFGGSTDYPAWYRKYGGAVLGFTIDKYCYINIRHLPPFFTYRHRIVYSKVEHVRKSSEIKHPAVRAAIETMNIHEGLEIHHDGDLPARSGLGSSSAFTVGLIHALKALEGVLISKQQLALQAVHIERDVLKETVGSQDQVLTAYGGLNKVEFHQDDSFEVTPVIIKKPRMEELQSHMMLFFTGFSRYATEIAKSYAQNIESRKAELEIMRSMVDEGIAILQHEHRTMKDMGDLLHESWIHKRRLSKKVSSEEIDAIYEAGRSAGAWGGKLLGAGGGGFILFFVEPALQPRVREKLRKLVHVNFQFDITGSKIVLYEPNHFQ